MCVSGMDRDNFKALYWCFSFLRHYVEGQNAFPENVIELPFFSQLFDLVTFLKMILDCHREMNVSFIQVLFIFINNIYSYLLTMSYVKSGACVAKQWCNGLPSDGPGFDFHVEFHVLRKGR